MKNNLYKTKGASGVDRLLIILLVLMTGFWSSGVNAATITSTAAGGLWTSTATWVGGVVPGAQDDVVIANGSTVTINNTVAANVTYTVRSMTVGQGTSGILQWGFITPGAAGNIIILRVKLSLLVNSGAKLLVYTPALRTVTTQANIEVGDDFINNGYTNLAFSTVTFRGTNVTPDSIETQQVFGGTGYFVADSTVGEPSFGKGLIRSLSVGTVISGVLPKQGSFTMDPGMQGMNATVNYNPIGGNFLQANGKMTLNPGGVLAGLHLNRIVSGVVPSNMGSGYTDAKVAPAGALYWAASQVIAAGDVRVNGSNVYVALEGGTASVAPTHPVGNSTGADLINWLWIGNTGTIGNAYCSGGLTPVVGTQYFYDDRLYTCVSTGTLTPSQALDVPTHTSGTSFISTSAVSFRYDGTAAELSPNVAAGTVRSFNILNTGYGYRIGASAGLSIVDNGPGTGAAATAIVIQSSHGALVNGAGTQMNRSGEPAVDPINIVSRQSVVCAVTDNGGVNYTTAPTVGFALPFGYRNLVTAGGSGYTTAGVTVSGGVHQTTFTDPTFNVVIGQGKIVSVIAATGGSGWLVPPTLTITGDGSGATAAFPAGSLATADANLTNGTITSFTITNGGADYTVGTGAGFVLLEGGSPTIAAAVPACRLGTYNLRMAYFSGSAAPATTVHGNDIPANGRINNYELNSAPAVFPSNIEFYGTVQTFSAGAGPVNLSGNNMWFSNPLYAGTVASATTYVTNGSVQVSGPGGRFTRAFPFAGISINTGGSTPATFSTITSLKAYMSGIPTGTVNDSGLVVGGRSFRIEKVNASESYGTGDTLPTVTTSFTYLDGLPSDNPRLYLAQASSTAGPWTIRSIPTGTGNLPAAGSRTTGKAAPYAAVLTGNDFFAWTTTAPPPAPLAFNVTRTTSNAYTSIMLPIQGGNGTGNTFSWAVNGDTDDNLSTLVSIPSSTFTYHGDTVTGFKAMTNGYMILSTTQSPATVIDQSWDSGLPHTQHRNVIAAFMDDLTNNPDNDVNSSLDSCMRYSISGTVGARKITVEWFRMTLFGLAGPELYFQIVLDESDKSIQINYGNMQQYNGTQDIRWTYTTGLSGSTVQQDAKAGQTFVQQYENSTAFSHINGAIVNSGSNGLTISPEPRSSIKFTPGAYAGYSPPATTPPSNDESVNAIALPSLTAFPTNIAWNDASNMSNLFTTRYATHSPEAVCGGSATGKDVWFSFNANETSMQVRVYGSGGFIPRLEVLDEFLNPLAPAQCVLGLQGDVASAIMTGLTNTALYYVRVYHNQTGTTATGTATVANGVVSSVSLTGGGSGYVRVDGGQVHASRVTFSGGGGNGAVADIGVSGGAVSSLSLLYGGRDYTSAPTVTIESPDWGISGEFGVIVFAQAPNDECAGAIALTSLTNSGCVGGANSRANVVTNAANLSAEAACEGTPDDDVWYKFDAIGDSATITVEGISGFNPVVEIWDGGTSPGNCGSKTSIACYDSTGASQTETHVIGTTSGKTYYIRVYHAGTGSGGVGAKFDICISSAPPQCVASPIFPANAGTACESTVLSWNSAEGASRYNVFVDGNLVSADQTDTTYATAVLAAGAHNWKIVPENASGQAAGCATWTFTTSVKPNILVTPLNASYCGSGSVSLTAAGAGNYTWTPSEFLSGTTGASVTANPPFKAGSYQSDYTYTVIGYNSASPGCPDTATKTVTVNRIPPAPATANYSICLNGSITPGQGLGALTVPEVFYDTVTFTPIPVDPFGPNEGITCPGNTVVGQFTLPALPPGATYTSARIRILAVDQRVTGSFANEVRLHLSGTGVSGTSGCYRGSPLGSSDFNYVTGTALGSAGDTAIIAGLLNIAGGEVTLTYSETFDDNSTVPDYTFPGTGTIEVSYTVPANTVSWYTAPTGGTFLFNGTPYAPTTNSPAGTYPSYARSVTAAGCESSGAAANLEVGNPLSVTASHTATSVICAGYADTLSSTVSGGGSPYSYSWSDGASVVSTSASFIANPTAASTTYTLTVSSTCPGTAISAVTTTTQPSPTVTVLQSGAVCNGVGSVALTASGANTYSWTPAFGLNTQIGATVVSTPGQTVTYTVTGTSTANGCTSTKTSTVVSNPHITITNTATPGTVCADSTTSQLLSVARYDSIPSGYCIPVQGGTSCILSVSLNTLSHVSGACSGSFYTDVPYNTATTNLTAGSTYTLNATFDGPVVSVVWIDLNRNGVFETFEGQILGFTDPTVSASITIDPLAPAGYTKMRIRSREAGSGLGLGSGCTPGLTGSTEDYTISIGTPNTGAGTYSYGWAANADLSSTTIANPVAAPTAVGTHVYTVTATEASGCSNSETVSVTAIDCSPSAVVNLKAFIEGYYIGGGQMTPTLFNEQISASDAEVDTVTIEAYDGTTFTLVDSYTAVIDTGGNVTGVLPVADIGSSYYIGVKHRNGLHTFTANPILFTAITTLDLTLSPTTVAGNNVKEMFDTRYAIFSGDVNGDEYIDTGDVTPVDNDNLSGLFIPGGYWISDINGDGYVDTGDVTPTDNNNLAGVFTVYP